MESEEKKKEYTLLNDTEIKEMEELIEGLGADPKYAPLKAIHSYIKIVGSVRNDVFDYVMDTAVFKNESVPYINELIKGFAGPEWIELVDSVEDKELPTLENRTSIIKVYQQAIIRAFREGLAFDEVKKAFDTSRYPFEMNLHLQDMQKNSMNELLSVVNDLKKIVLQVKEEQKDLAEKMATPSAELPEESASEENQSDEIVESSVEETVTELPKEDAVIGESSLRELVASIRKENELSRKEREKQNEAFLSSLKELFGRLVPVAENNMPAVEKNTTEAAAETTEDIEEEEVALEDINAELEESFIEEPSDFQFYEDEDEYFQADVIEFGNSDIPSEEIAAEPTEESEADEKVEERSNAAIVKEIVKDNTKARKQGVLFQKLRARKRKASFNKMTDNKKMEELFLMMKEKSYTSEMIQRVRECLSLKISYEFIYSFIEMDVTSDDFDKLITFRKKESNDKNNHSSEGGTT